MKNVLILESDRITAKCLKDELAKVNITAHLASNADAAISIADEQSIDAVVSELSLPGHSGSEFLYEFNTYTDWSDIPIIVFSSIKPKETVTNSRDWQHLGIIETLYKPEASLQDVVSAVQNAVGR